MTFSSTKFRSYNVLVFNCEMIFFFSYAITVTLIALKSLFMYFNLVHSLYTTWNKYVDVFLIIYVTDCFHLHSCIYIIFRILFKLKRHVITILQYLRKAFRLFNLILKVNYKVIGNIFLFISVLNFEPLFGP